MNALLIVGLCVLFLIVIVVVFVIIFVKVNASSSKKMNVSSVAKPNDAATQKRVNEHEIMTGLMDNGTWIDEDLDDPKTLEYYGIKGGDILAEEEDEEDSEGELEEEADDDAEVEEAENTIRGKTTKYEDDIITLGGNNVGNSGGKANKVDPNKPIVVMFSNLGASPMIWSNAIRNKAEFEELNFVKKLKRIGEIHYVEFPFNNINYYYNPEDPKIAKIFKMYKEQNAYSPDINFTLEDLDFKKLCTRAYNDVVDKYGSSHDFIVVGHSHGCDLAKLFCKMYKSKCKLCVCINDQPHVLNYYKKHNGRKIKSLTKPVNSENKLKKALNTLSTTSNKKEANEIYEHIQNLIIYYFFKNRFENFDPKIYVPTLFFKAIPSKPVDEEKVMARLNRKQKRETAKDPNMKLFKFLKDAESNIWWNQKYSDAIIRAIKKFL